MGRVPVPGLCCLRKEASQRGMVSSRSRAVDLFQIERLTTSAAQRLGWARAWQGGGRGEERKGEARSCAWSSILGRHKLHLDFTTLTLLSLSLSLFLHALLSERLTAGQFCLPPPVEYSKQRPRASFIFILPPCSSRPPRFQPGLFKSSKSPPPTGLPPSGLHDR